jgi:hypothetical protein
LLHDRLFSAGSSLCELRRRMSWWTRKTASRSGVNALAAIPQDRAASQSERVLYRDYHLEPKSLMVGWQVTISQQDNVIRHTGISATAAAALAEARRYVDTLLPQADAPPAG